MVKEGTLKSTLEGRNILLSTESSSQSITIYLRKAPVSSVNNNGGLFHCFVNENALKLVKIADISNGNGTVKGPEANRTGNFKSLFICNLSGLSSDLIHSFPKPINVSSVTVSANSTGPIICVRANWRDNSQLEDRSEALHRIEIPMDAKVWNERKWTSIVCSACESCILSNNNNVEDDKWRVLNLPSEHWIEFVDCWVCHDDQKLHESIGESTTALLSLTDRKRDTGRPLKLRDNQILISKTGSIFLKCLSIPVTCPGCSQTLGRKLNEDSVELYQTRIGVRLSDTNQLLVCSQTILLAHSILEHILSHSIYRFKLSFQNSKSILLFTQNWDISIDAYNCGIDALNSREKFRAIKVVYCMEEEQANSRDPLVSVLLFSKGKSNGGEWHHFEDLPISLFDELSSILLRNQSFLDNSKCSSVSYIPL